MKKIKKQRLIGYGGMVLTVVLMIGGFGWYTLNPPQRRMADALMRSPSLSMRLAVGLIFLGFAARLISSRAGGIASKSPLLPGLLVGSSGFIVGGLIGLTVSLALDGAWGFACFLAGGGVLFALFTILEWLEKGQHAHTHSAGNQGSSPPKEEGPRAMNERDLNQRRKEYRLYLDAVSEAIRMASDPGEKDDPAGLAWLFCLRGIIHGALTQFRETIEDCTRALAYDARYAEAYIRRAQAYHALGYTQAALSDLHAFFQCHPTNLREGEWQELAEEAEQRLQTYREELPRTATLQLPLSFCEDIPLTVFARLKTPLQKGAFAGYTLLEVGLAQAPSAAMLFQHIPGRQERIDLQVRVQGNDQDGDKLVETTLEYSDERLVSRLVKVGLMGEIQGQVTVTVSWQAHLIGQLTLPLARDL